MPIPGGRPLGTRPSRRPWWSIARYWPGDNIKTKWTRAVQAITLLEHVETPDAVAILKDMATGHPLAQPTRAAKEALGRIGGT